MIRDKTDFVVEDTSGSKLRATPRGVKAFVDSRYGMSIHWGLYALKGRGEWVYYLERIPWDTYRRRLGEFNPARFNAEEWADLMVEAGQKLLLITSKHHDGFCLWDTPSTDWKITSTPFRRDVLAELAQALRDRGIALHFYYSLLDWTYPACRRDWPAYVAYYQGQVRELCTRFGPIGGILFDGYWPRDEFNIPDEQEYFPARGSWDLAGSYDLIHSLQPDAVVTNNGHLPLQPGEDYQVWEENLPEQNTSGSNTTEPDDTPKACWWNLNSGWAYAPATHAVKDTAQIMATMLEVNRMGGVFMLNVGPRPWGDIHPDEQAALRSIGRMLRRS
jgi:alpha-L-fucosidase